METNTARTILGTLLTLFLIGISCDSGSHQTLDQRNHGIREVRLVEAIRLPQTDSWGDSIWIDSVVGCNQGLRYVADHRNKRILVIDTEGNLVLSFLEKGQGPGEFQRWFGSQIIGDEIYIYETGKICRFRLNGTLLSEIKLDNLYSQIKVLDQSHFAGVLPYPSNDNFKNARAVAGIWDMDETNISYLGASPHNGRMEVLSGGTLLTLSFRREIVPNLILNVNHQEGTVLVCDNSKYHVDAFDNQGNTLYSIERQTQLVVLSEQDKHSISDSYRARSGNQNEISKAICSQLRDTLCAITSILITPNGLTLIERPISTERNVFDVYDTSGVFLLTIKFPKDIVLTQSSLLSNGRVGWIDNSGELPAYVEYEISNPPDMW